MALGLIIAACAGVAIGMDASKRGMNAALWGVGVFLLLIVFLPIYFIVRKPLLSAQGGYPMQQGMMPQQPGMPHGAFPQPQQPGMPQGAFPQPQQPGMQQPGMQQHQAPAGVAAMFAPGAAVMVMAADGQRYPGTVNQFQNGQYLCTLADGSQNWFQAQSVSV